jgi:MHS family citrate/tricarballylate:H+ symporter-like MFS transporter
LLAYERVPAGYAPKLGCYAAIGILAPLLVLSGRLLQGFSAGVELGGVSVYLSEMATPGHKGFYVAWQSASQQVAIIVAAAIGYGLNHLLAPAAIGDWGWRVPFFIGCLIVPFIFMIRRSLKETQEFLARKHRPSAREIVHSILENWQIVIAGMLLVVMTTVSFYLITVYTPTYGKSVPALSESDAMIVTFCVGLSNFFWLPVIGALSGSGGAPANSHYVHRTHDFERRTPLCRGSLRGRRSAKC